MRLLADEHVKPAHVSALVAAGHDVVRVGDVRERGVPDSAVREAAWGTDRVVLTYDRKDFSTGESRAGVFIATEEMKPTDVRRSVERVESAHPTLDGAVESLSDRV